MKYFSVVLLFFLSIFPAAGEVQDNKIPEFRLLSRSEERIDALQSGRFAKRLGFIRRLVENIDGLFLMEDAELRKIEDEILVLGDECYNLHSVSDLSEKNTKHLKKQGNKINNKCLKMSRKMGSKTLSEIKKKYGYIREMTIEMLIFCETGDRNGSK